jgi:hypothetical protein
VQGTILAALRRTRDRHDAFLLRDLHAHRNLLLQRAQRTGHRYATRIDRQADAGGKLDGSFANSAHVITR